MYVFQATKKSESSALALEQLTDENKTLEAQVNIRNMCGNIQIQQKTVNTF